MTSPPASNIQSYPFMREAGCPFDLPVAIARPAAEPRLRRVRIWDGSSPWLVTHHEDVRAVLADQRFSAAVSSGYPAPSAGVEALLKAAPNFAAMDDPEHNRFRRTLVSEFTARRIAEWRPTIEAVVGSLIDAMLTGPKPAEFVQDFALRLPLLVISRVLGVPNEKHAFVEEKTAAIFDTRSSGNEGMVAAGALDAYLEQLVDQRLTEPREDLLSRLAQRYVLPGEITQAEAAVLGMSLVTAGHETTANQLALGLMILLDNPEQRAVVRDGDEAAVKTAVEEILRLLTVDHHGRRRVALEDLEVGGVLVRAGEGLIIAVDAANRDPAVFEHPDDFDVTRAQNPHVAFGYGAHMCIGASLARAELLVALPAVLNRLPDVRVVTPPSEIRYRNEMLVYGVENLAITW